MRTTIKFLILFLIFGCKNQTQPNTKSISENSRQQLQTEKTNPIYGLIIRKKETAENLGKEFSYDSIISLTKEEKSKYKKIGLNDGYYLTNIKFLKKSIDSIDFKIYYKVSFGGQLEKLVRIKTKDTVFDLTLTLKGGDGGQTWREDLEFLNDSIFQVNGVYTETAIDNMHLMAYETDSIIRKYQYDGKMNFREIKKDSFHFYKKYPTYHKDLKDKIFKTWSSPFKINDIQYQWEYEVKYADETNENSKELLVNLVSQKLITWKTKESVLDLDLSLFPYLYPLNISDLEYNDFKPQDFDINFDGYNDFQFYDRIQGGANHEYFVYLFDSNSKKFEFSKELTGGSMAAEGIELDKVKRIAYYSGKSGGGLYGFRRVHFNLDGSIKYEERFWNEDLDFYSFRDSINHYKYAFYYLRKKNNITIDSLRVEKEVNDGGLESIYGPFFEWVKTFDK